MCLWSRELSAALRGTFLAVLTGQSALTVVSNASTDSGVKCKLMHTLTYTYSHVEGRCLVGATTVTRCAIPARVETALGLEPGHAPVERPVCNYKVKNTFFAGKI